MRLTKWYADCVTPDGGVAIAYVAELAAGPLTLAWTAALESPRPGTPLVQHQAWSPGHVQADAAGVHVAAGALGLRGRWQGGVPAAPRVVIATPRGDVIWQALTLGARAELAIGSATHRGAGYVEVVRVDVAPWHLPVADLVWGRFVSDDGGVASTWTRIDGVTVTHESHPAHPESLTLDESHPLRVGNVPASLLGPGARRAARVLPARLRDLHEAKYLARGHAVVDGRRHDGWVIHEQVRFG